MTLNKIEELIDMDDLDLHLAMLDAEKADIMRAALRESKEITKLRASVDVEKLREAVEEMRPLYENAEKIRKDKNDNFCGMNKDRPKKSASTILFESTTTLLELVGETR